MGVKLDLILRSLENMSQQLHSLHLAKNQRFMNLYILNATCITDSLLSLNLWQIYINNLFFNYHLVPMEETIVMFSMTHFDSSILFYSKLILSSEVKTEPVFH